MTADRDDLTTRFLLGELSEAERREVEERFLSDNEFFEQIMATEDALIDQYLEGSLSKDASARAKHLFESSNEQRRNVAFTKELTVLLKSGVTEDKSSAPAPPTFIPPNTKQQMRVLWAAIAFVALLLGSWIVYLNYQRGKLMDQQAAAEEKARQASESLNAEIATRNKLMQELESERQKREQAENQLAQLPTHNSDNFTPVVLRPAVFERSQGASLPTFKVSLPQLRLQLVLDTDRKYEKYQISITTFGGELKRNLHFNPDRVRQGKLTFTLPADALGFDDFRIELRGASADNNFEHIADYAFRLRG